MSFEVTVTPTVYNVEVEVNPSVQPFDVQVITQQDLADLVDEAKQYAEDAEDSADSASASASSASASASASASSANSASASASSASASANTATTQAGIATTQAGIATTQAGIATTKANEASQSASDALASEQASAQSASDALQSEQNALASEQASALSEANALASEQSASASASTATTQAGIATTQAGIATAAAASIVPVTIGTPANGLSIDSNQVLSIGLASGSANGALSSTDWSTFNAKQNALTNPITGTGTSGQVAFWTGTGAQSGDSGLTWDNATKTLLSISEVGIFNRGTNSANLFSSQNSSATGNPTQFRILHDGANSAIDSIRGALLIRTNSVNRIIIDRNSGNVMINTGTDAGFRLDVNGTARVQGALTTNLTATRIPFIGTGGVLSDDAGLVWDNVNKRLGIGTSTLTAPLQFGKSVYGEPSSENFYRIKIEDVGGVNNDVGIGQAVSGSLGFNLTAGGYFAFYEGTNGERMRLVGGNLLLNTTTNAGFRLDVNGTTRLNGLSTIQGTTASDSGQLGTELLTTGTGDASWTGSSFATGYTHVAGSTTTLTSTLAGVVNNFYQITYTVTGRTAGSFTIAFGGFTSSALTATGAVGPRATTTDTLVITPTSNFNGTIVLSIRVITASSASVTFNNSSGAVTNQIRISSISSNTFIGFNAGIQATTGESNSFYGRNSGQNTTTGGSNSFFGINSGQSTTIGESNSFFGRDAGISLISGNSNSFFGRSAGVSLISGDSNSFFGRDSGRSTTTGGNNSFFGVDSGRSNTTGNNNSFFGLQAGINQTTGSLNVMLGRDAGRFIGDGSNLTVSDNSIFIGFDARANSNSQTNQIVIGHTAIGAGSNTATLGNTSIVDTILRGRINLQQYATGSRPAYVKGALIYDSTLGKLVVGGNSGWEVVTSS
jgi:hypothetical protein